MRLYPESAMRRAMKRLEVLLKTIAGEIKWIQAADILGVTPRTIRRIRAAYLKHGFDSLVDKRRGRPSPRRVPYEIVEKVLKLYKEQYFDFTTKHFHEVLVKEHEIPLVTAGRRICFRKRALSRRAKVVASTASVGSAELSWGKCSI